MEIRLKVGGLTRGTWGQVAENSSLLVEWERESIWVLSLRRFWHTFALVTWENLDLHMCIGFESKQRSLRGGKWC